MGRSSRSPRRRSSRLAGRSSGPGRGGGPAGPASFFITSVGKGDGANYGGIAGADAYCAQMAQGAGWPRRPADLARVPEHAGRRRPAGRERARSHRRGSLVQRAGQLIANNVADLHGDVQRDRNSINKTFALTEKGTVVNGVGDMPNQHDILTGSDSTGRAGRGRHDTTCSNYTSNACRQGQRDAGSSDRTGGGNSSWNSAHGSRGCSQPNLVATGGAGLALLLRGELETLAMNSQLPTPLPGILDSLGEMEIGSWELARSLNSLQSASLRAAAAQA